MTRVDDQTHTSPHMEHREFLWKVHGYTNDYIRFADTKAAIAATAASGIIGALLSSSVFDSLFKLDWMHWPKLAFVAFSALLLLAVSVSCSIAAIWPRLRSRSFTGFIFWDNIVEHRAPQTFSKAIRTLTNAQMDQSVSDHVFILATICKRKYRWVNRAIAIGVLGASIGALVILLLRLRK
jgi:hypothetical protein